MNLVRGWSSQADTSADTRWPGTGGARTRFEGWPTGIVPAADSAISLLESATAWWDVSVSGFREGDRWLRNLGTAGQVLDLQVGSSPIAATTNDPTFLMAERDGYCFFPGSGSLNYLTSPDEAALDITTDFDIRIKMSMPTWTPAATQVVAGKWGAAGGRSYYVYVTATGLLGIVLSFDGTATSLALESTTATGLRDNEATWVRWTLDALPGSGGKVARFYVGDGTNWTQVGADASSLDTSSAFVSTSALTIGGLFGGVGITNILSGKIYEVLVLNGIGGTTVLDIDFSEITDPSVTSFTATTGQTITVNRASAVSEKRTCLVPSIRNKGVSLMLLGVDDYLEIPVTNDLQNSLLSFDQGESFTALAIIRQFSTATGGTVYLGKQAVSTATLSGWSLTTHLSGLNRTFLARNIDRLGSSFPFASTAAFSTRATLLSRVTNRSARTMALFTGTPTSFNSNTSSLGNMQSLRSTVRFSVGRSPDNTLYNSFEFYAGAVFRRALSSAEVKTISDYYTKKIA